MYSQKWGPSLCIRIPVESGDSNCACVDGADLMILEEVVITSIPLTITVKICTTLATNGTYILPDNSAEVIITNLNTSITPATADIQSLGLGFDVTACTGAVYQK